MLTIVRVATGQFEVLWNGAKTSYCIINGSTGLSGRDTRNIYGIVRPNAPVMWIGSLHSCKGIITQTFKKYPERAK